MSNRRVVIWWQDGSTGIPNVEVHGRETMPNHDNPYELKGKTNNDGFIEFNIVAEWVNWDIQIIEPGMAYFIDGQSVGPNMTYVFNRKKLIPEVTIKGLRTDFRDFRTVDNQLWKYRGYTGFTAVQLWLNGQLQELEDFGTFVRSMGGNTIRSFGMWSLRNFDPRSYGLTQYVHGVRDCTLWMASRGLYHHFCFSTDQVNGSPILMSNDDWRNYYESTFEELNGLETVLGEVSNEDWKNGGVAPSASDNVRLGARSSWQDGQDPRSMGALMDFTSEHTPRDWDFERKAKNLWETTMLGGNGWQSTNMPAIAGEPQRITIGDARQHADYAAIAMLGAGGSLVHGSRSDDGNAPLQDCQVPTDPHILSICEAVKDMWTNAQIPLDAVSSEYSASHLGNAVCEEAGAMKSYAKIQGNKATLLRVRETSPAQLKNGWNLHFKTGPQSQVYHLVR